MEYEFIENVHPKEHDAFVGEHPLSNLLQSSNWAMIKDNWDHVIIGVKQEGELVASSMILIRKIARIFTLFYIPRGPVLDFENKTLLAFYFKHLKQFAKKHHCVFVKFDPAIQARNYTFDHSDVCYLDSCQKTLANLTELNCIHHGFTTYIEESVQPRFHTVVYKEENGSVSLTKSLKKALTIADKKMIEIEYCDVTHIPSFVKLMQKTEARKNIHLRDQAYFEKLMNVYKDDAVLLLAKCPILKLLNATTQRLEEVQTELANCPDNAKKKRFTLEEQQTSLNREVKTLQEQYQAYGEEVYVSGALCVKFYHTSEILYAGMDDAFKRYMAPYKSFLACMEYSFEHGCNVCSMGGIEGDLKDGLSQFKANFNPLIHEFIGEFDFAINKALYHFAMMAMKIRKGA